jgi:hypothetical protein
LDVADHASRPPAERHIRRTYGKCPKFTYEFGALSGVGANPAGPVSRGLARNEGA